MRSKCNVPILAHCPRHTLLNVQACYSRLLNYLCDPLCFLSGCHVSPHGIFLHSAFLFFSSQGGRSPESCTVAHVIMRGIVLNKFDVLKCQCKTQSEGLYSWDSGFTTTEMRTQAWMWKIKMPAVLLLGVKNHKGDESVCSEGINQSLTAWNR